MDQPETISDVLKQAITESGLPHVAIERATGVKRASIMRFLRGEQSLRLDMADRLAAYFGLELRRKGIADAIAIGRALASLLSRSGPLSALQAVEVDSALSWGIQSKKEGVICG